MDLDDIYENVQTIDIQDSIGPQTQNQNRDEVKDRKQRSRSRYVLGMIVSLGLLCVVLLLFITLQHSSITAERDLFKNTVEELNLTISSLQHNNTDLNTEKQQLENSFSSLNMEKMELERNIKTLRDEQKKAKTEKQQLEISFSSLNLEKMELERNIKTLRDEQKNSNNTYFFISTDSKTWSESRKFCREYGGDLVMIKTEEKQRFITSFIKERMWIGLSDTESEGKMTWVDNSPLIQSFWAEGEPNNYEGADEDCVEVRPFIGTLNNWNDLPCTIQRQCICEK